MTPAPGHKLAEIAWAKLDEGESSLSVAQHCRDAAAVAAFYWDSVLSAQTKRALALSEELSEEDLRTLTIFLAAIHDTGKLTKTFQLKGLTVKFPELATGIVAELENQGLSLELGPAELNNQRLFPHGVASGQILSRWLRARGVAPDIAVSIAAIPGAHHGLPPSTPMRLVARDILDEYSEQWHHFHDEFLDEWAEHIGVSEVWPAITMPLSVPTIQILTGIVIVADWIASNADAFPYIPNSEPAQRVRQGLAHVNLAGRWHAQSSVPSPRSSYYHDIFQWPPQFRSRGVQPVVLDIIHEEPGAQLMIIEAGTGEGKTEASLAAAHLIAAAQGSHGVIFAAPTMATANGLFSRVIRWAQAVVPAGDQTAAYLAHSKNHLVDEYRNLKLQHIGSDEEAFGSVTARQWLSGSKKGLLANFVISTIDQVLMMSLQTKHSMLRHLALSGKVVIIDEVHAYDTFMSEYLLTTLQWLAWLEVPVILLSATLPVERKNELVRAYRRWEDDPSPWSAKSSAYPLITYSTGEQVSEVAVAPDKDFVTIAVEALDDNLLTLIDYLDDATSDGGCALVVCNSVLRAQQTFKVLTKAFPGLVELHHAAFTAADRAAKEEALIKDLGPRGNRPYRKIYVSTQVVEQSLDIDVDLLITDIAPIDLLLQRAGRLHRHPRGADRPKKLRQATMVIRGVVHWDPFPEWEGGAVAVYDPLVILASAAVIKRRLFEQGFQRPHDLPDLVRSTYATIEAGVDPLLPPQWAELWEEARAGSTEARETSRARAQVFKIPPPDFSEHGALFRRYITEDKSGSASSQEEAVLAQVRDAEPTIEVIVIVSTDAGYRPWGHEDVEQLDDDEPPFALARILAACTLRLPAQMSRFPHIFDRVITILEQETPAGWLRSPLLKGSVALRLQPDGTTHIDNYRITYSDLLGLSVVRTSRE